MKHYHGCLFGLGIVTCAFGCSGGDGTEIGELAASDEPTFSESEPARVVEQQTIAELFSNGQKIAFLQWGEGEDAQRLIRVSGSVSDGGSVVDALESEAGPLTMLEIFRALAPDEPPPSSLVDAHAAEASALQRGNEDVQVVEKFVHTAQPPFGACHEATVFPGPISWSSKQILLSQSGRRYLCAGSPQQSGGFMTSSSCTRYTLSRQRVVACVPNGSGGSAVTQAGFGNLGGAWSVTAGVDNVAPGQWSTWEFPPNQVTQRRLAIEALGGTGYTLQSAYGG